MPYILHYGDEILNYKTSLNPSLQSTIEVFLQGSTTEMAEELKTGLKRS
jgi:hypothetical protein